MSYWHVNILTHQRSLEYHMTPILNLTHVYNLYLLHFIKPWFTSLSVKIVNLIHHFILFNKMNDFGFSLRNFIWNTFYFSIYWKMNISITLFFLLLHKYLPKIEKNKSYGFYLKCLAFWFYWIQSLNGIFYKCIKFRQIVYH